MKNTSGVPQKKKRLTGEWSDDVGESSEVAEKEEESMVGDSLKEWYGENDEIEMEEKSPLLVQAFQHWETNTDEQLRSQKLFALLFTFGTRAHWLQRGNRQWHPSNNNNNNNNHNILFLRLFLIFLFIKGKIKRV